MLTAAEPLDDPFSPKRVGLLLVLADAMFAEPADAAAQRENDKLPSGAGLPQNWCTPARMFEHLVLHFRNDLRTLFALAAEKQLACN